MENRARRQSRNNEFWLILKKMDNSARYYSDLGPLQYTPVIATHVHLM